MSEPENFLERWSRRKREVADDSVTPLQAPEAEGEETPKPASFAPVESIKAETPFDISSLPSLDSIAAETDIRGFLQAGVPEDLKNAALRRAWSADPQIRDFVGLVENGWDFNDPNAMHGFGPIEPSEVARLLGNFAMTPPPAEPSEIAERSPREPSISPPDAVAAADEGHSIEQEPAESPAAIVDAPVGNAAPQNESATAAQADALPGQQKS